MPRTPIPETEQARLEALRRYAVLDTSPEETFDRITRLASSIFGTPIALISLVDETRQWSKSAVGLDSGPTPRDQAFCAHAILSDEVLVVPDATADDRFLDNPLVTGAPGIRFYAGAPLTTPDGHRLGTLCVIDHAVRDGLTPFQQQELRDLAALVVDQLELRRSTAELKTRLEELEESEQRYRLLFRNNPQPMWVYDSETYAFLDVNAASESMYGYSRDEFLAMTILDIRPAEETAHVREMAQRAPEGMARTGPWRHLRKDGSVLFVRISSHPTLFEGRRARLVLAHDISAEKQLEEQLVQAQKMEAIGQLAGGVAHDFNNLLTVINGYAQLLDSRLHEADPLRVDAGHILHAGERAASLTQQLLAFSRRQVLQPRPLDVGAVVENLRPMLRRLLRDDIEVHTSMPAALPPVMVDPVQLEQVLLNLAINGSRCDARWWHVVGGGQRGARRRRSGGAARRAGGPYVAVPSPTTASGWTKRRVAVSSSHSSRPRRRDAAPAWACPSPTASSEQSGGNIVVQTTPGEGSTFTVYLPLAHAPVSVEEAAPAADIAELRGHETVLVVEDHEAVRRLAADVLRAHGYHVLVANQGTDAIALVESRSGGVDLLLTDVIMPRMSGRDVARALQQRVPDLAVLFMSGYTQTAIVQDGALESGLHFLAKPFTPAELLARVREVLATRAAHGVGVERRASRSRAGPSRLATCGGGRRRTRTSPAPGRDPERRRLRGAPGDQRPRGASPLRNRPCRPAADRSRHAGSRRPRNHPAPAAGTPAHPCRGDVGCIRR